MFRVYLLLGANLGKRFDQMRTAFEEVEKQLANVVRFSSLYETEAWGKENEPSYLNQVIIIETSLEPLAVLKVTQGIESQLGRTRKERWEARLIDIDILFYEDLVLESSQLTLPHPYLHLRKFTLVPLVEIAPHFIHPVLKKSNEELLRDLKDELEVKKIEEPPLPKMKIR